MTKKDRHGTDAGGRVTDRHFSNATALAGELKGLVPSSSAHVKDKRVPVIRFCLGSEDKGKENEKVKEGRLIKKGGGSVKIKENEKIFLEPWKIKEKKNEKVREDRLKKRGGEKIKQLWHHE